MFGIKETLGEKKMGLMIASFAAVYLIWGSTYLAIKYAIETLPTFLMAGTRFLVAGSILYAISRFSRGYEKPQMRQWRTSLVVGALLLGIGNGAVVMAEHYISSGLAALLVATLPFWMVLLGWMFMGTGRPNLKVTSGLLLGFVGVAMLIVGRENIAGGADGGAIFGIACVIFATLGWAIGSLYGSRAPSVSSPVQMAGMQMLCGGALLMATSLITGEWATFDPRSVSMNSWLALAYLIVFGAIVAFSAFAWLLKNSSPAAISTYAYVNPLIAVFLGWVIAGESMSIQMLVGAAIIVGSVALITSQKKGPPPMKEDTQTPDKTLPSIGRPQPAR